MRELPPKGLIVSCYLESMAGCEKAFIAAVCNLPRVVALRVEGLPNVEWARYTAPEKFIVGLIKSRAVTGVRLITETVGKADAIIKYGADMVATDCLGLWGSEAETIGYRLMYDVPRIPYPYMPTHGIKTQKVVLATTHTPKAFAQVKEWREAFPNAVINLEGGIETPEEMEHGFDVGADYVTIGKAFNDPPTIIKRFTG